MTNRIKATLLKIEAAILGIGVIRRRETARSTDRQEASRPDASEPMFAELGRYLVPAALFVLVIAGGVEALTLVGGNDGPQPSPDGGRKDERAHHEPLREDEEPGKADRIMEHSAPTTAEDYRNAPPIAEPTPDSAQTPPATPEPPAAGDDATTGGTGGGGYPLTGTGQESDQYEPEQYEAPQYEPEQYEAPQYEPEYPQKEQEDDWLNPDTTEPERLLPLLQPYPDAEIECRPPSRYTLRPFCKYWLHTWPDPNVQNPPPPLAPTTKQQCKNGGYTAFGFKSQGQCIKAVTQAR